MNTKSENALKRPVIFPGGLSTLPSERLKELRRERDLVEQAILALTEVIHTRRIRVRRTIP